MPPIRRARRRANSRFPPDPRPRVRKPKWHGKGWREFGDTLWFNVHRSWAKFTRGEEARETDSLDHLVDQLERSMEEEDVALSDDLHFEFFLRKTQILPEEGVVGDILDGGETVYAKIFDDEGVEYVDYGDGLEPKTRGRR